MRKTTRIAPHNDAEHPKAVRLPNGGSRPMRKDTATVAAATHSHRINMSQWLDTTRDGASLGTPMARAAPGGAQTTAVGPKPERTVALSDGTRITFAPAIAPHELEPIRAVIRGGWS
jgi:hypothetical protein